VLDQNMYYLGAKLTSATFASALVNILPAITFLLALALRMERLRLRSLRSQAKVVGTVCTVAGAVLMILYHGPVVPFPWSAGRLHHHVPAAAVESQSSASWLNGICMIIGSCLCWSGFFILQVRTVIIKERQQALTLSLPCVNECDYMFVRSVQSNTLQSYPAELTLTTLICFLGSVLTGGVALVAERRDMSAWVIGFDTRLFTAVYSVINPYLTSRAPYTILFLSSKMTIDSMHTSCYC
jgi:drug/metabolite transporter (DMT)-like permease